MKQLIGIFLISLPLIVISVVRVKESGWESFFYVWVFVAVVMACIWGGAYLVVHP